jgi:hypothetical protein
MDWLNDRKNLPLVAIMCVMIVLGAIVWILYSMGYLQQLQRAQGIGAYEDTGNNRFLPQNVPTNTATAKPPVQVASNPKGVGKPLAPGAKPAVVVKPTVVKPTVPKPNAVASATAKPIALPPPVKPLPPPIRVASNPQAKPVSLVNPVVKPPSQPVRTAMLPKPVVQKPGPAARRPNPGQPVKPGQEPPEPPLTSKDLLKGNDPFKTATLPPQPIRVAMAPSVAVPALNIVRYRGGRPRGPAGDPTPDGGDVAISSTPAQTALNGRRVSGIMFSNGVYALLEQNGQTYTVQPGDMVEGDRVLSIEADGIMMKTANNVVIRVPLSEGDSGATAVQPAQQAGPPGMGGNFRQFIPRGASF